MDVLLVLGWGIYVGLTLLVFRQRARAICFVLYAVLCALLVLNVVGCHMILREPMH